MAIGEQGSNAVERLHWSHRCNATSVSWLGYVGGIDSPHPKCPHCVTYAPRCISARPVVREAATSSGGGATPAITSSVPTSASNSTGPIRMSKRSDGHQRYESHTAAGLNGGAAMAPSP